MLCRIRSYSSMILFTAALFSNAYAADSGSSRGELVPDEPVGKYSEFRGNPDPDRRKLEWLIAKLDSKSEELRQKELEALTKDLVEVQRSVWGQDASREAPENWKQREGRWWLHMNLLACAGVKYSKSSGSELSYNTGFPYCQNADALALSHAVEALGTTKKTVYLYDKPVFGGQELPEGQPIVRVERSLEIRNLRIRCAHWEVEGYSIGLPSDIPQCFLERIQN